MISCGIKFKKVRLALNLYIGLCAGRGKLPRRYSKLFLETFIKIREAAEANTVRDLGYAVTFLSKQLSGAF